MAKKNKKFWSCMFSFKPLTELPNGLYIIPIISLSLSNHPEHGTWMIHLHTFLFKLDFGRVDDQINDEQ